MFAFMEDLQYILAIVFWHFGKYFKIFLTLHSSVRQEWTQQFVLLDINLKHV
jgi:hypothetical protein